MYLGSRYRVVDPVVDVELGLGAVAYTGTAHIGLVGDDQSRSHRVYRKSRGFVVISDGRHHGGDVLRVHVHPVQQPESHDRPALGVIHPVYDISDVVEITGYPCQLDLVLVVSQVFKDAACQLRDLVDMWKAVLRIAQGQQRLVGFCYISLYIFVVFYFFKSHIHIITIFYILVFSVRI